MADLLAMKGAEQSVNVTNKFDTVILYGFISNMIFLLWQVYKMGMSMSDKSQPLTGSRIFMEICIALVWMIQLILVLSYRFSHTGKVCAGDFAQLEVAQNETSTFLASDTYSPYYIKQEGDLLYFYFMVCVFLFISIIALFLFFGSFMFMGGSLVALMMLDEGLSKVNPDHQSKRASEEAAEREAAQNAGRGGSASSAFREEFKND